MRKTKEMRKLAEANKKMSVMMALMKAESAAASPAPKSYADITAKKKPPA